MKARDFGMFTPEGNLKVQELVMASANYDNAVERLIELQKQDGFREAFDTEVRAAAYEWFNAQPGN